MDSLGGKIRKLREEKKLPLRTVALFLSIDQAILSKIERGQRKASREQVVKLSKYFKVKEDDLLVAWLSDKLVYELKDESVALQALQVAEERVEYRKFKQTKPSSILLLMKKYFQKDKRVDKAWIFGSFARGDDGPKSDIDVMIQVNSTKKFSLFDFADIQYHLEKLVKRKIDLVEEGAIQSFAWETAKNDLKLIYER